jgi:hypothetical protein
MSNHFITTANFGLWGKLNSKYLSSSKLILINLNYTNKKPLIPVYLQLI